MKKTLFTILLGLSLANNYLESQINQSKIAPKINPELARIDSLAKQYSIIFNSLNKNNKFPKFLDDWVRVSYKDYNKQGEKIFEVGVYNLDENVTINFTSNLGELDYNLLRISNGNNLNITSLEEAFKINNILTMYDKNQDGINREDKIARYGFLINFDDSEASGYNEFYFDQIKIINNFLEEQINYLTRKSSNQDKENSKDTKKYNPGNAG